VLALTPERDTGSDADVAWMGFDPAVDGSDRGGRDEWLAELDVVTSPDPSSVAGLRARVTTPPVALPYRTEFEAAFGESLPGIEVHGGEAEVMQGIGGVAAAEGNVIAFAEASPSRGTVAHECRIPTASWTSRLCPTAATSTASPS
jgi:hypothetical protein